MEKPCVICDVSMIRTKNLSYEYWARRRTCSMACSAELRRREPGKYSYWAGKPRSEKTRRKIGDAHRGKALTAEHRKNISEAHKASGLKPPGRVEYWPLSEESKAKISASRKGKHGGPSHHNWKENAGYDAMHSYARRNFEKPLGCEHCGEIGRKKYEWALRNPPAMSRDRATWLYLCVPCHIRYDQSKASVRPNRLDPKTYKRVHARVNRAYAKTGRCENCRVERKTAWANRTGEYRAEDRSDWAELCYSCHKRFDLGRIVIPAYDGTLAL